MALIQRVRERNLMAAARAKAEKRASKRRSKIDKSGSSLWLRPILIFGIRSHRRTTHLNKLTPSEKNKI